ncbi:MAG: XdhC family protein [Kangiellaceae bacterium]|jgi:xanthine dehydrogenase accessory factor|nr:XdhC family protein [Kangiellaceae bacterium]
MNQNIFQLISQLEREGKPFAVATVVDITGSVSAKTSAKAVIDEHGKVLAGWVGGGCAESATCEQAMMCIESKQTAVLEIDMDDEVLGSGMPCGGKAKIYVEPVLPQPTIWIMGHGRVAETISIMGKLMNYRIVVNDPGANDQQFPDADKLITDDLDYEQLTPKPDDYVIIATQHKGDHESIMQALSCDAQYIALIASRKRSRLVLDYLREEGVSEEDMKRVIAPSGIDLKPATAEEIALCLMSEITMLRRSASGQRMKDRLYTTDADDIDSDDKKVTSIG